MKSEPWQASMQEILSVSCMIWRQQGGYRSVTDAARDGLVPNSALLKLALVDPETLAQALAVTTEADQDLARALVGDLTLHLSVKKLSGGISAYEQEVLTLLDQQQFTLNTGTGRLTQFGPIARMPEQHRQALEQEALVDMLKHSEYLGRVGDKTKLEFELTLIKKRSLTGLGGSNLRYHNYRNNDSILYVCKDPANNLVKFFHKPLPELSEGHTFRVRGKIKKHAFDPGYSCASTIINYVKFI